MKRSILFVLFCAQLWLMPIIGAQSVSPGHESTRDTVHLKDIVEPPELAGAHVPTPPPPSPALREFVESKIIQRVNPDNATTLDPAIRELTALILAEPNNSDFHLLRATLSCYDHGNVKDILDDLTRSISLHGVSKSTAYPTLRDHYGLKAKVEFESGRFEDSMRDLDAAIKEGYDDAEQVFNDGKVEPSIATRPCVWTQADFDILARRFPTDYRPPLYRGLYLTLFYGFDLDSDYSVVLDTFHRASLLNPASPLPHFFIGELYTTGRLGGITSKRNATCLDDVVPRTQACLSLDETRRTGIRSLTQAIALDPKFGPAYALRAEALLELKEYRQAIRDYDAVLKFPRTDHEAHIAYNDRGVSEAALGLNQAAVVDYTRAIGLGCETLCSSYDSRAEAYIKLHSYTKAIEDISASIRLSLSYAVFQMNVDQFRRIYPEYDSVPDDALCEKLRAKFFPNMRYEDFARQFLIEAKEFHSTVVPDLYIKRGDAYAALKMSAKANTEYDRVSRGFPKAAAYSFVEKNGKRVRAPE